MENRFGVKDFFLFLLTGALILLVLLAMKQFDRQYEQIMTIKQQNETLAADVARVKRALADGVALAPGGGARPGQALPEGMTSGTGRDGSSDPFYQLIEAQENEDFARGGWFRDNFGTKVGKITPLISTDVYASWVQNHVMESLAVRDPYTLEFLPVLARGWIESEDGLELTVFMRTDPVFSDGEPVTAEDVVWSFQWAMNPEVNAPRVRAYMDKIQSVEQVDRYTVKFTFTEPYFKNFETAVTSYILPKHFYEQFTASQFNERPGLLMGSGPYRLESPTGWSPGSGVMLVRNVRYWGEPGTYDRISFDEIQEEAAQMVKFKNQEHDVIQCTPEQYEALRGDAQVKAFAEGYAYDSPYRGYSYIGWNQRRIRGGQEQPTPFADKRVRQALTMLVDRERMLEEIFLGYGRVATGPFSPIGPQADPEIEPWPYDPARARALLAEAGFIDRNGDGVIQDEQGRPLRFTLTYPGGQQIYEKIIRFLRDNFARGGIIMDSERLDWNILVDRLNKSDFDAIILGWSSTPESDINQMFHSSQIKDQGDNRTSYANPELDRAIEQARTTMNPEERYQFWHQVHRIIHEDQPYTFLLNRQYQRFYNGRIRNIEQSNIGLNYEYMNGGVMPWYTPTEQQMR